MAGILSAMEISSQGLSLQRKRLNTVAQNIANAETTETKEGGPYRRKRVLASENKLKGTFNSLVKQAGTRLSRTSRRHLSGTVHRSRESVDLSAVTGREIVDPDSSFRLVYDPSHPQADGEGYVKMPDVGVVTEMVDMMAASRAYEANTVAISAAKKMAKDALEI